jgi:mono/diheme cytochrome c family protein
MKKKYYLLPIAIIAFYVIAMGLSPENSRLYSNTASVETDSIPNDLQQIFKKSCMGCHSTGGNMMAMSVLNFTEWTNYAPAKQMKKASAICKEISNGSMPPKSFRKSHPDAITTEDQINSICKWSELLNQKK